MNFLDRSIAWLSPSQGLRRARARSALNVMTRFAYEGAKQGRRTEGWTSAGGGSANAEIGASLVKLRERSRDLVRNNPHASKAINVLVANAIGTGIIPQAKTGNVPLDKSINDLFKIWNEEADADGLLEFYGLQKLIARTVFESGEAIIRFRSRRPQDGMDSIPLQIQVLEPDYLDLSKNLPLANGGAIIHGVEFDVIGTRVAYWIFNQHPGEVLLTNNLSNKGNFLSKRILAEDVLHIYEKQRPGQVRGVPWRAASVMLKMRDLDDYAEAELVRKKIEACFAAFVTQPEGMDGPGLGPISATDPNRIEAFEPGMVEYLKPGEEVSFGNPQGSGTGAAEYERQRLHDIAAGWGITYEQMTGDLTQVNYSSFKAGHNEFRAQVEEFRWNTFIPMFCSPVWRRFIDSAVFSGKIQEANYLSKWTPPKFQSIDATKDAEAALKKMRSGTLTLKEAIAEEGYDPDDQLNEIEAVNKILDAKGIILDSDPRKDAITSKTKGDQIGNQANQAAETAMNVHLQDLLARLVDREPEPPIQQQPLQLVINNTTQIEPTQVSTNIDKDAFRTENHTTVTPPTVNVAQPMVSLNPQIQNNIQTSKIINKSIERDKKGNIVRIVEEEQKSEAS